jgi:hypothetical protein
VGDRHLTPAQIEELLQQAPDRIREAIAGLTPAELKTPPDQGDWSITEVLAHMRACADVWAACIDAILAEARPTIRAINPRGWIKSTNYPTLQFRPSFEVYSKQRAKLLKVLEPLPPRAWTRSATVVGAGAPLQRTVHFYAQWLATHENTHVKQIGRIARTFDS